MRDSKIYDSFNAVLTVPLVCGSEELSFVLSELRKEEGDLPPNEIQKVSST